MKKPFFKSKSPQKVKLTNDDIKEILYKACELNKEEREQLLSSVLVVNQKLIDLIPPDFFKEVDSDE